VFRPVTNNRTKELDRPLYPGWVYHNIVQRYGLETGVSAEVNGLCVHSLRATATTNALSLEADIAKVQEWLGHANVSTTRLYDRRKVTFTLPSRCRRVSNSGPSPPPWDRRA